MWSLFLHKWGRKYILQKHQKLISSFERWIEFLKNYLSYWHLSLVFQICWLKWVYLCEMIFKQMKRWSKVKGDITISFLCFLEHPSLNLTQSLPFFTFGIHPEQHSCNRLAQYSGICQKAADEKDMRKGNVFLCMTSSAPSGFK